MMDEAESLYHYGVKGMRWGKRKATEESEPKTKRTPEERRQLAKKVAIGAGILAAVAATAYVGYQLSTNGKVSVRDIAKTSTDTKKKAEDFAKKFMEPDDFILSTRSRDHGHTFLKKGGLPDAMYEYERAGFGHGRANEHGEFFSRYGQNSEKVAARFTDPEGLKDRASRPIFHEVVVPKSMASQISSLDDVREKVWPLLKDEYRRFYDDTDRG